MRAIEKKKKKKKKKALVSASPWGAWVPPFARSRSEEGAEPRGTYSLWPSDTPINMCGNDHLKTPFHDILGVYFPILASA